MNKYVHFSIDDVLPSLRYATLNMDKYESIFELDFYSKLKKLHEKYSAIFSLFLYSEKNDFHINQMTDKFKRDFVQSIDWLKLGYHGFDSIGKNARNIDTLGKQAFIETINAIERFADLSSLTKVLRLHKYEGTKEFLMFLNQQGVKGVLTADDDRISYDLTVEECSELDKKGIFHKNSLYYYKTYFRIENLSDSLDGISEFSNIKRLNVFTHEWAFKNQFQKIEKVVKWLNQNNFQFLNYDDYL
ncbi:MAG: hypothetical protein K0R00_547 [Herbinix sp.]|nr:hypothetical protein [Herbinix sp.]